MNIVRSLHVMLMTIVLSNVVLQTMVIAADHNPETEKRVKELQRRIADLTHEEQVKVKRAIEQARGADSLPREISEQITTYAQELSREKAPYASRSLSTLMDTLLEPLVINIPDAYAMSYSPDSKHLACADPRLEIQVWNIEGRQLENKFHIRSDGSPTYISYGVDGKTLLVGLNNGAIIEVSANKGHGISELLEAEETGIHVYAIKPQGRYVAWARATQLGVYDLSNKTNHTLQDPKQVMDDYVFSVSWSHDGKFLASGYMDGTIKIWNIEKRKLVRSWLASAASIFSVSWSRDGNLAAGSENGSIRIWNPDNGKLVHTLPSMPNIVGSVAYSSDGLYLAAVDRNDNTVKIWNINKSGLYNLVAVLRESTLSNSKTSLQWSLDGKYIAIGNERSNIIKIWAVEKLLRMTPFLHLNIQEYHVVEKINEALVNRGALITPENPQGLVALTDEDYKVLYEHEKLLSLLKPLITYSVIQAMKIVDNLDNDVAYTTNPNTLSLEKLKEYKWVLKSYKALLGKALRVEKETSKNPEVIAKITNALTKIDKKEPLMHKQETLLYKEKILKIQSKKQHGGKLPPF